MRSERDGLGCGRGGVLAPGGGRKPNTRQPHCWGKSGFSCHGLIVVSRPDGVSSEFYGVVLCWSSRVWGDTRGSTPGRAPQVGATGTAGWDRGGTKRVLERGERGPSVPRGIKCACFLDSGTRFVRTGWAVLRPLSQNVVKGEFTIPRPILFAVHVGTVAAPVAGNKYRQVAEKGELSVKTRYSCSTSTPVLDEIHAPHDTSLEELLSPPIHMWVYQPPPAVGDHLLHQFPSPARHHFHHHPQDSCKVLVAIL